jgi:phosphoglycolate phosphatase
MHLLGAIERVGGDVAHAVMVGDSETDVAAARAAGVPIVLVDFGYTDRPAETLGGDLLVSDLAEVAAAAARLLR